MRDIRSERQMQREEQFENVEKLNSQFHELHSLMAGNFRTRDQKNSLDEFEKLTREVLRISIAAIIPVTSDLFD